MKNKSNFDLLQGLYATLPDKMIEDFAVKSPEHGGSNYVHVVTHLRHTLEATEKQIDEIRLFLYERQCKAYSLNEAVADIAQIAGQKGYYSGDSRADIAEFISWAKEFEFKKLGVIWGESEDYMDEIEKFTESKLKKD